jgi:hypothetical protein
VIGQALGEMAGVVLVLAAAIAAGMWRTRHAPNPPQWPKPPNAPQDR